VKTVPLLLKDAEEFLKAHERHYKAPVAAICAIGVEDETGLHGAVILGHLDKETAELAHVYADGASEAYTTLYGSAWRSLKALGYKKTVL
jgi:hypothetical protein